jgi:PAS domain S-box-containing protein
MGDSAQRHGPATPVRERFLEALLESAVDFAIVATDADGRVTEWNAGAERILGWSAEEMRSEVADRFFTPEDRAEGRPGAEMRRALETGRANDERWHVRRDGSRFWASGEMMPLRSEDGAHLGFLKILRDGTGQRQAAEAQRVDAEFLRSVLASSGDCIKVLDLDGNLVFMSEGGQRVMEVGDFNAIRGCPWPDFWQDERNADARAAVEAAKAGGTGHFRGSADTMAGNLKYWDVQVTPILGPDGQPEKLLSVSRDITATQHAEAALREAQGLNTAILHSSRDCIVVLDLDGHTQFVSPGGIEAMEITDVEAILGLSWLRVWQGADHEAARAAVAEARASGVGRFQGFCPTHKGTPKWWDVVISPIPGPDGKPERLVSAGRDITARKRAEAALRLHAEEFQTLADNIPTLCWMAHADGHIHWYNRRWYDYTGTSPENQEGWGWESVHDPDILPQVAECWRHSLATGEPFEMTFPLRGADGVFRPFLTRVMPIRGEGGEIARWFGTNTDITRQHAAEEALRELNATLEQQVEQRTRERDWLWELSEDLLVAASYDGHLLRVSPSWTRLLGHDEETLLTRPYAEIVHPDDLGAVMGALLAMRESRRPVSFEDRVLAADGTWRWIAWTLSPEPGGERLTGVGRDITAAKTRQAELEVAQEQLRQSQKMEAVGQLTGGLAHDFNNLLTGVTGSLELLQTRITQGRISEVERYVLAAQGAANRAAALTHRLLAFSRRQTLDPKPTNLNRLIGGMEELIRRTVGPAVTVEVVGAGGLWTTLIDPNQLENALLNLCINARDAMPDGGRLTIETENKWLDGRTGGERDLPPGQYLSLCVTDTGTGMAPEVIKRAFDPFFTTKPIGMGTGLGLSMVYGFARQSGGQVRIYSEIGQGTTMCIYLPRHHGPENDTDAAPEPAGVQRSEQGKTVLVVDDEPTVRMLVAEVLEELGYTAIEASDGAGGLRVLQSDARIDLLVTDVGLPGGMNGRQVADAGRVLRPGLKVLFITGYAENAVVGNGHLDRGMQVLTKPFAMEALASRIKALVAEA